MSPETGPSPAFPDGTANFRAVPAVRPGWLFRSDSLHSATPAGARFLTGRLGVGAVLDLRSAAERASQPHAPLAPRVRYAHVPLREIGELPRDTDDLLGHIYVEHLGHDPHLPAAVEMLSSLLARSPTVVCCAAGKDRTGMVIALSLGLAGAPREVILRDYLASGPNMPQVVDKLKRLSRYRVAIERLPHALYECRASSMAMLLDAVEREHGSFHGWARAAGVSAHAMTTLRAALDP